MDDTRNALSAAPQLPQVKPLSDEDLRLIAKVREDLVVRGVNSPSWRDKDPDTRMKFFNEVRSVLISKGETGGTVNNRAQMITDALSGVGLLDQILRDPYVEEIFVRNGKVAVEHNGTFYHLGKLADDSYFYNLAVHVADQGGQTIRGDRPAVLVDLPNGERFTAIVPKLSTDGTAINIRTFGRRIKTLEQMEKTGTFARAEESDSSLFQTFSSQDDLDVVAKTNERIETMTEVPARFLAWMASSLSGSVMIAGGMGSGKTTLLNALSGFLPPHAPIATLETFRELEIQHPFLLRTVAPAELPAGTPGVTLDWVLNVIYTRMNPAAVLVGEVVGREALQFLKAASLGRKAFTTIHGGTVEEALMRLEQLALASAPELGLRAVRAMIGMGVNVVVLMGRSNSVGRIQRALQAIALLKGVDEDGEYVIKYLYRAGDTSEMTLFEQVYQRMSHRGAPQDGHDA